MKSLTDRETEVLQHMACGDTYRQAGHRMGLTASGAQSRAESAIHKLGALSITHAVHLAGMRGLIGWYRDCGSRYAYRRHLRNGEVPCAPCRCANASVHSRWVGQHRGAAL